MSTITIILQLIAQFEEVLKLGFYVFFSPRLQKRAASSTVSASAPLQQNEIAKYDERPEFFHILISFLFTEVCTARLEI